MQDIGGAKDDCGSSRDKKTLQWLNNETDRIIAEQQKKWGEEYRIDDERNRAAFKEVHAEFLSARNMAWLRRNND